jgi:exosortase
MSWSPSNTPALVRLALLAGCLTLAFGPLLAAHAAFLWQRPHYQHFPIVPLGAAYLAYRHWPGHVDFEPGGRGGRLLLLGGAWTLLAIAILGWSPWLGMIAALALVPAIGYCVGGGTLVRQLLPAWAILWLIVPLPLGLDTKLIAALQPIVTRASSRVLDLLEVCHVPTGNVLVVEGRHILVEEACSGIQSLYSLFTCACLYALWARRPFVPSMLLLIAAAIASVLANICRVVATAYLTVAWGVDVEEGWRHEAAGMVAFVVALGLLWSWDHFLWFLWHPIADRPGPSASPPAESGKCATKSPDARAASFKERLPTAPLILAFGLLACLQMAVIGTDQTAPAAVPAGVDRVFDADALPATIGAWARREFKVQEHAGKTEGRFSSIWTYDGPAGVGTVSLDTAYAGWHTLEMCYQALGWTMDHYEVRHVPTPAGSGETFVAVQFHKPLEGYGYLYFGLRGERGQYLSPPTPRPWTPSGWARLCKRLRGSGAADPDESAALADRYEQEQLFVETAAALPPDGVTEVEALFHQSRQHFRKR